MTPNRKRIVRKASVLRHHLPCLLVDVKASKVISLLTWKKFSKISIARYRACLVESLQLVADAMVVAMELLRLK